MRKLLIKLFVLDYKIKFSLLGLKIDTNIMRAPTIIFPIILTTGITITSSENYPTIDWYEYILLALLSLSVWFGFFHWEFFPVKWGELDNFQKWVYGIAVRSGKLTKPIEHYDMDLQEWQELNKIYS